MKVATIKFANGKVESFLCVNDNLENVSIFQCNSSMFGPFENEKCKWVVKQFNDMALWPKLEATKILPFFGAKVLNYNTIDMRTKKGKQKRAGLVYLSLSTILYYYNESLQK